MKCSERIAVVVATLFVGLGLAAPPPASAQAKKPNILVIMGDDVGWFPSFLALSMAPLVSPTSTSSKVPMSYLAGLPFCQFCMSRMLGNGGSGPSSTIFCLPTAPQRGITAEASCTAGRANFITGELPIRTGLTTVGQAGADVGLPDQAATIASALKVQGYEAFQFGNHLGDLNKYLPCLHGFDEFFGYLYHLDAMSDPYWFDYPQDWIATRPDHVISPIAGRPTPMIPRPPSQVSRPFA